MLHRQAVCRRGTKKEETYIMKESKIVTWLDHFLVERHVSPVQRRKVEEVGNGFLGLSRDTTRDPTDMPIN